jgi:uncharacterized protein (TIGR03435 family)
MMKRTLLLGFGVSLVFGQTFEAASIKLSDPSKRGSGMSTSPARIKVINSNLKFCIQMAFDVKDFQVSGGPGWTDTERYDIDAVAASPFKEGEFRLMLRAMLAERFGLAIHHETQEKQGYSLVVGKNGPKLPPPIEDQSRMFSRTPSGDITFKATSASLKDFASALANYLGSTVIDNTGIDGKYDVSLQWTPDPNQSRMMKSGEPAPPPPTDVVPGPSIFTALQEKLGLKLESKKVPVDVIVIDRANRPTEN